MSTKLQYLKTRLETAPWSFLLKAGTLLIAAGALSGCGGIVGSVLGAPSPAPTPGATSLTGNWQLSAMDTTGAPAFSNFAGFIDQTTGSTLTAVFQVQPGTCYLGATTVPASGTVDKPAVSLSSFSVNGQSVFLTSTVNSALNQLTGTYQISGGCANGTSGTFSGTRYAPVTGTYTGSVGSSNQTGSFALTQGALGNGSGYSPVTGTATVTGISCFTSATLNPNNGYVVGSALQFNLTATDGETLALVGTFDSQAQTLTITSATISGGACAGSLGTGSLVKS